MLSIELERLQFREIIQACIFIYSKIEHIVMAKTSFSSHSEYQTQSWLGVFGHGKTMHDNLGGGKGNLLLVARSIFQGKYILV